MGTGLGHFIPLVAYCGFWVMCIVSLTGRPLYGLYYLMPFLPYRTMRDKLEVWPLGANVVAILLVCIIIGALLKGRRLPKSKLYLTWLVFAVYLYMSMWLGSLAGNAPAPVWLSDPNFSAWKDYMDLPLLFVAAGLVVDSRIAVRRIIIITAISLFLVDKSALAESLSRSWAVFDENKRNSGPLEWGPNQLAAFLAQFAMFFWGFARMMKRKKVKLICYGLTGFTIITTMYAFSRGAYLALLGSLFVLAIVKDRKLLLLLGVFLVTWQALVPKAVVERVDMTHNANGALDASAEERVMLWEQSEKMFLSNPVTGIGFSAFEFGQHVDKLKDTHNWYIKVLVETGVIGGMIAIVLVGQLIFVGIRLYRKAEDPLYRALGLGFILMVCSCLIANCFGDRWTYIEINGLLWILTGTAARAYEFATTDPPPGELESDRQLPESVALEPYLEWR